MSKRKQKVEKNTKVISLHLDATFFYQKAVKALDQHNYPKALRYFQRAVEFEPENPVNHCNVAGILSELGQYRESNKILEHVIQEVDPQFFECFFYMANNSANMEDFEAAEEYVIQYLEKEPDGMYVEEAEEILDYLTLELQRPPKKEILTQASDMMKEHDTARRLLEQGKFLEASRLLKKTIERYPDFLAARNNLSLTYYYMGRFEKAMSEVEKVLEIDANNLHALCNLAVFYNHIGKKEKTNRLMEGLRRIYPIHSEQVYKLATTMGILGDHGTAYRLFLSLYTHHGIASNSLLHQIAAAAYNQNNWAEAERWWRKLRSRADAAKIAERFLDLLKQESTRAIGYNYPDESKELNGESSIAHIRSSFFWALENGDDDLKRQVIYSLGNIGDSESQEILKQFLLLPNESTALKKQALYSLQKVKAPLPIKMHINGKTIQLFAYPTFKNFDRMIHAYANLYEVLQKHWSKEDVHFLIAAEKRLGQYISEHMELLSRVRKWEGVAAAIEYSVLSQFRNVSKAEIATRYGTSLATINKYLQTFM